MRDAVAMGIIKRRHLARWDLHEGDSLKVLRTLDSESVHCVVTSPPYWLLRDYGVDGQYGLEETPEQYVDKMVEVFAEVRRVLRPEGTAWINIGDTFAAGGRGGGGSYMAQRGDGSWKRKNVNGFRQPPPGLKNKDLCGIPWRIALALQADGWYLRSDIIWNKKSPMPESVKDRPTRAHEYIFLMTKSERYYYDAEAIKEPVTGNAHPRGSGQNPKAMREILRMRNRLKDQRDMLLGALAQRQTGKSNTGVGWGYADTGNRATAKPRCKQNASFSSAVTGLVERRNKRSVWTIATEPFPDAHFATFPKKLVLPCILAGCPKGGTVIDPFVGSGTTGAVAVPRGRNFIGIDINPEYLAMADKRIVEAAMQLPLEGIG